MKHAVCYWQRRGLAALALGWMLVQSASAAETPGLTRTRPQAGPFVEVDGQYMVPYTETIPGTDVKFEMIPIAGGEFQLGSSPDGEHAPDEAPPVKVAVAPYWIGKHEVTWAEFQQYMGTYKAFKNLQSVVQNRASGGGDDSGSDEAWKLVESHAIEADADAKEVDAVTSPTPLYAPDSTYMAGDQPDQPAVTMTQFAARQYTKWLSRLTAREYRLPSEAEWEYAARSGTSTAFSFGDDPTELEDYAWFVDNAEYATHPVGSKKPNPWGLYDMHGNAAEWTLDQYAEDHYQQLGDGPVDAWNAVNWPTDLNPRAIRGGSWLDEAPALRSAARHKSEEDDWKLSDPNLPLSPWWYTEEPSMGVGLRVVRALAPLGEEDKQRVWDADVEELSNAVAGRMREGRGAQAVVTPHLPAAIEAAEKLGK